MKYCINYKDAAGITLRSEHLPFDGDEAAAAYAAKDLPTATLIEVWNGNQLVVRFDKSAQGAAA